MKNWGFLTNHAHVLIQIARDPNSTVRQIALATGITERATHHVLRDLREAGILNASRNGRQNSYRIDVQAIMDHPRWAATDMKIPDELIEATVRGLSALALGARSTRS